MSSLGNHSALNVSGGSSPNSQSVSCLHKLNPAPSGVCLTLWENSARNSGGAIEAAVCRWGTVSVRGIGSRWGRCRGESARHASTHGRSRHDSHRSHLLFLALRSALPASGGCTQKLQIIGRILWRSGRF